MLPRYFGERIASMVVVFSLLAASRGYSDTGPWVSPPAPPLLNQVAQRCPTPEQLAQFLRKEMRFESDHELFGEPDYWQSPEEFLARRRGDCEDYALLAEAVLRRQGREAFVLSMYGSGGYAHTVCVFPEKEGFGVINQDRLVRYAAIGIGNLAGQIYAQWDWAAVARKVGHRGQAVRGIYRRGNPS